MIFPSKKEADLWPLLLGVILFFRLIHHFFSSSLPLRPGSRVLIRSCLDSQPRLRFGRQIFYLAGVKVITSSSSPYHFGDCLIVEGTLTSSRREGRGTFLLKDPLIERWSSMPFWPGIKWRLKRLAFAGQQKVVFLYRRWLPEPAASLMAGIVLGVKSQLPADFFQQLRTSGTLHIVVASGYNLTVISRRPIETLAWLTGRRRALIVGWLMVWSYVLLTGAEPPVVRAAIIISLIYLAQFWGRKFAVWRAFWTAIWLMLFCQPELLKSLSFQLSVAAMAGLLLFENCWPRLRRLPWVGKELADSLSAQLMVLPLIAHHFGEVSWAAPLVNMFVLPLIPRLMMFGLPALGGLFFSWLALSFLYLSYPLLWWVVKVITTAGRYPWLSLSFPLEWWGVGIYYFLLFLFLRWQKFKPKTPKNCSRS